MNDRRGTRETGLEVDLHRADTHTHRRAPITDNPGTSGLGTPSQSFLEQSNVDLVTELTNLLIAQRTFTFNSQAIQIENATLQATFDLIR